MRKCVLAVLTLSMIFSLMGCGNSRTEVVEDGQSMAGADTVTGSADRSNEPLQAETNIVPTGERLKMRSRGYPLP